MTREELVGVVARAIMNAPKSKQGSASLTALCAALRIPPAALDALAAGEAVVAPMVATDAQALGAFERDMGPDDDLYLSIYRAMVAASPYAPEAKA
jgi:hypothetical protein